MTTYNYPCDRTSIHDRNLIADDRYAPSFPIAERISMDQRSGKICLFRGYTAQPDKMGQSLGADFYSMDQGAYFDRIAEEEDLGWDPDEAEDYIDEAEEDGCENDDWFVDYLCEMACYRSNPEYFGTSGPPRSFEDWRAAFASAKEEW